jgi:hypothetical protein
MGDSSLGPSGSGTRAAQRLASIALLAGRLTRPKRAKGLVQATGLTHSRCRSPCCWALASWPTLICNSTAPGPPRVELGKGLLALQLRMLLTPWRGRRC